MSESALEIAREIVAEHGDGEILRARAALCRLSGYDEDGDIEKHRAYVVAADLLRLSAQARGVRSDR